MESNILGSAGARAQGSQLCMCMRACVQDGLQQQLE